MLRDEGNTSFRNVSYDLSSATTSNEPLRELQTLYSHSVLPDFSLLVTTLPSGNSAVSVVTTDGCLLWAAVHCRNVCYRLRKGDMARGQAGSSVFIYSISKIQWTASTLGLAVSGRMWGTLREGCFPLGIFSPEMLHVYILRSLFNLP